MTVYISPEDKKLFEKNGFTTQKITEYVTYYREQGLSDDEIQSKINASLNFWKQSSQLTTTSSKQIKEIQTSKNENKINDIDIIVICLTTIFILLTIFAYIFPSILAHKRNVENKWSIVFVDIFFGWTIIGYIAAFIWVHLAKRIKK